MTKEDRAYCVAHGYCTVCGAEKAQPGYRRCLRCRMDAREDKKRWYDNLPEERKKALHAKNNAYMRVIYEQRKADGICPRCGERKLQPGQATCAWCRAKGRNYYAKHRGKWRHVPRGMMGDGERCACCGKPVETKGAKVCERCCATICTAAKISADKRHAESEWYSNGQKCKSNP